MASYDPVAYDPIDDARRRSERDAATARAANSPLAGQPVQAIIKLKDAIKAIERHEVAQDEILEFLLTQSQWDFNWKQWSYDGTSHAASSTPVWLPYDPAYDCELTVQAAGSGLLKITVGSTLRSFHGAGIAVGWSATWGDSSSRQSSLGQSVWSFSFSAADDTGTGAGYSKVSPLTVPPRAEVVIRSRRAVWGAASSPGLVLCVDKSLEVFKQW